ncbi:DUF2029 domain-containing protein [Candidatus Woesebacteria bacterium]|nr:DUF2029 domain-containing protein [Candidatus Woesebacteria bacterium]
MGSQRTRPFAELVKRFEPFKLLFLYAAIAGLVSYSFFSVVRILTVSDLQDFGAYYVGAQAVLQHQNPYLLQAELKPIYPPSALLLLSPLGLLPKETSAKLWTVLSYSSLLTTLFLLPRLSDRRNQRLIFSSMLGLTAIAFPAQFTLGMGQINLLILLLITFAFWMYQENRYVWVGVVLGLAASFKIAPLILVFFFIRKKCWKAVISFAVSFLFLQLAGGLALGFPATEYYWLRLFPHLPTVGNASYYNQALTGFLARAGVSNFSAQIINYAALLVLTVSSFLITKSAKQSKAIELGEYSLFLLAGLLAGGLAWQHHFVVAMLPLFALWLLSNSRSKRVRQMMIAGICISFVLIAVNIRQPSLFHGWLPNTALSHVFWGGVLLYGLVVWVLKISGIRDTLRIT